MSLRMRWFLVIGGLVALLVAAQGWWVSQLARDLSDEEERVAVKVGRSMAHVFLTDVPSHSSWQASDVHQDADKTHGEAQGGDPVDGAAAGHRVEVLSLRTHSEKPADDPREVVVIEGTQVHRRELRTIIECDEDGCREQRFEDGRLEERQLSPQEVEDRQRARGSFSRWFDANPDGAAEAEISLQLDGDSDNRFLTLVGPNIERRVAIPHSAIDERLEAFTRKLLLGSAGIFAIGLLLAGLLAHRVTRPLQLLAASAQRVGEGEWGAQVPVEGSAEVAQAIGAFNHMSRRLAELDASHRDLLAGQHLSEIGEIARGLAHSLRNPLNALGLSVDQLASGEIESGEAHALAEAARQQIRRVDQSLRSFLALASQGGGVVTSVDLGQMADDVALEALHDARGGVRLVVERQQGSDLTLSAVEPELRAVLQALVVNAIEASPPAGQVTVRVGRQGDGLVLQVDDEGPGLPPEVRQRLFTPHLSTKANGSGMGLFLAHRIAGSRYGGHLELQDLQPTGTRAALELKDRAEPVAMSSEGEMP